MNSAISYDRNAQQIEECFAYITFGARPLDQGHVAESEYWRVENKMG